MISEVVWMCALVLHGVCSAVSDIESLSVMEGDPVTLHNDINVTTEDTVKWFFKNTRIAEIDFYNGKNCTDVQCDQGAERFRGRLKLDHQTGCLTINNTRIADSGEYKQQIIRTHGEDKKTFNVTVYGDTTTDRSEIENITVPVSHLSGGARAAICVVVLLLIFAVLGIVVGVLYHINKGFVRPRNEGQPNDAPVAYGEVNNDEPGNGEEEEIEMQPMQ